MTGVLKWTALIIVGVGVAVAVAVAIVVVAGGTGSASARQTVTGAGSASAQSTAAGTGSAKARPTSAAGGDGLHYALIKEPFSAPGQCDLGGTTVDIADCYLKQVVRTDKEIDVLQKQRFEYAPTTKDRKADLKDDAEWLAGRLAKVQKINTGGSIDRITQAQLTLKLSQDRLHALS